MLFAWTARTAAQDEPSEPTEGEVGAEGEVGGEAEAGAGTEGAPSPEQVAGQAEAGAPASEAGAEAPPAAEPAPPPAKSSAESEEMVVTGSRIKRSNYAQPSSVAVVDRKQLQMSGANNMADVVKYMNINTGSEFNADIGSGTTGGSQFNLRGLGLNATLVLLNGRRLVQAASLGGEAQSYVDINTLPLPLVERFEILKGGASAIYGSDAVAGVVNLITRKNFDGFEAQVGGQATDKFDQHEWDVSLLGGSKSETTRVTGMLSYFKREPLFATDRDFTNNKRNVSNIGWPGAYLPVSATGTPIALGKTDPNCLKSPLSALPNPVAMSGTNPIPFCTFDFNSYYMLVYDEQRVNAYTTVEHDISAHTMAFFEGGYARSNTSRILSPSFAILQPTFIPADSQYNPFGQRLKVYSRLHGGSSPPQEQTYQSDTLHTVAGISGDFGGLSESKFGEWEWEVSGTYSTARSRLSLPDLLKGPFQDALNHCTPADDPANCLNLFYAGAPNSQTILDKVNGQVTVDGRTELTTLGADLNGPIVKLPGGNLALALGTQVRREVAGSISDHDSNQFNYNFLAGSTNYTAQRRIFSGYGELSIPFFQGFETQAAARLENYSDAGSAFNPMAGISWTPATTFMGEEASPASKVRVRGTYARSFVAPSLLQDYGSVTVLTQVLNTAPAPMMPDMGVRPPTGVFVPVRTLGNPLLNPQTSTAITGGVEWAPVKGLTLQGDYWNYDYQKIIVQENAQQLVDKDFKAAIPTNGPGNPAVHRDPSGQILGVDTQFVNAQSVTTHGIDLDVGYRSDFGANAGIWGMGVAGSYVLAYEIPLSAFSPTTVAFKDANCNMSTNRCDVAGLRNATNFVRPIPRLRATLPLSWGLGMHTVAVIGHLISGYKDDGPQVLPPGTPPLTYFPNVDMFVSFDIQYSIRIEEGPKQATTIKVGVLNIANAYPPYVNGPLGYDTLTHDPRGRMLYARLIQEL
jgi:outer membrane receptor protein involved in Fe transport